MLSCPDWVGGPALGHTKTTPHGRQRLICGYFQQTLLRVNRTKFNLAPFCSSGRFVVDRLSAVVSRGLLVLMRQTQQGPRQGRGPKDNRLRYEQNAIYPFWACHYRRQQSITSDSTIYMPSQQTSGNHLALSLIIYHLTQFINSQLIQLMFISNLQSEMEWRCFLC